MEIYDTKEYSKVKCYSVNYVGLRNIYSSGHKKHQHMPRLFQIAKCIGLLVFFFARLERSFDDNIWHNI